MGFKKKYKEKDIETIKQFVESGKTIKFIASEYGVSYGAMKKVLSRNKISTKNKQTQKHGGRVYEDLSTRIRILKGEEVRKSQPFAHFSDEQINTFKENKIEHCETFCKTVLNVELQDYQLECINKMLNSKRFVGVMGRQSGKDFLLSCFVVWQSIINSNSKILLVSASQRASDLLYNRVLTWIGSSNELFDSVKQSNAEKCIFKNGSEIWSLPATGMIRGFTEVTCVICNEAHEIPEYTFSSVEPMLAVKNGSLYIYSTPRSCAGRLWEAFNDPLFTKVQYPSTINKYVSKDYIELQKQTMDSLEYDMEINAQFQQTLDRFFSMELIEKNTVDYDLTNYPTAWDRDYFLGIDWGRKMDSSVLTIISKKEKHFQIENIIELNNVPFPQQLELIRKLYHTYRFQKIVSEYAGLGIPPSDILKAEYHHIVICFQPTIDNKEKAYHELRSEFEDSNLTIPKHQKLQYELRTFVYEMTSTGKLKLHHLANSHDDFVDSLMLAFHGAKERQYGGYISI